MLKIFRIPGEPIIIGDLIEEYEDFFHIRNPLGISSVGNAVVFSSYVTPSVKNFKVLFDNFPLPKRLVIYSGEAGTQISNQYDTNLKALMAKLSGIAMPTAQDRQRLKL